MKDCETCNRRVSNREWFNFPEGTCEECELRQNTEVWERSRNEPRPWMECSKRNCNHSQNEHQEDD